MKKILVHCHIYYPEMWSELKKYIKNIAPHQFDLCVTLVEKHQGIIEDIKKEFPQSEIEIVENRGYDVGPFIHVLNKINLDNYEYVIKIHSKNPYGKGCALYINGLRLTKRLWISFLLEGILGSHKLLNKIISQFQKNPKLGMVGAKCLITNKEEISKVSQPKVKYVMHQIGYNTSVQIKFIAGTMFICRAQLLKPIKANFTLQDFEPTDMTIKDGTLAHALERVCGTIVLAQGYELKGYDKNYCLIFQGILNNFYRFLYQSKVTRNNMLVVKIFKLPVYQKKLN